MTALSTATLVVMAGCSTFKTGRLKLDFNNRRLRRSNRKQDLDLNDTDWRVLACLTKNAGKETLAQDIASTCSIVDTGELISIASKLRELLGKASDGKYFLTTTAKLGFKLRELPAL